MTNLHSKVISLEAIARLEPNCQHAIWKRRQNKTQNCGRSERTRRSPYLLLHAKWRMETKRLTAEVVTVDSGKNQNCNFILKCTWLPEQTLEVLPCFPYSSQNPNLSFHVGVHENGIAFGQSPNEFHCIILRAHRAEMTYDYTHVSLHTLSVMSSMHLFHSKPACPLGKDSV